MDQKSYADRLGDALEAILGEGVDDLDVIVARLNASGLRPVQGELWTSDGFIAELKRLGE